MARSLTDIFSVLFQISPSRTTRTKATMAVTTAATTTAITEATVDVSGEGTSRDRDKMASVCVEA